MNTAIEDPVRTLQLFAPDPDAVYNLDIAAHVAGVSRHWILVYCKRGFVSPLLDPEYGGYYFDQTAIRRLQRVEYLRSDCGINFAGIEIILSLVDEMERLRER